MRCMKTGKRGLKLGTLILVSALLLISVSAFTQEEVLQKTPAFHLFHEIYVKIANELYPLSEWLNFTYDGISVQGKRITNVAPPISKNDAATKGYVDAALGVIGSGGMGLQGVLVLRDNANNYGISSVPISLPKAGCNVKITVCDYGGNPPTKLIIGADPVPRITKKRNDAEPIVRDWYSPTCTQQFEACLWVYDYPDCVKVDDVHSCSCDDGTLFKHLGGPILGSLAYEKSNTFGWCGNVCPYAQRYSVACCPKIDGYIIVTNPFYEIRTGVYYGKCRYCPVNHPNYDSEDDVCYATPRCPDPDPGEIFIQEDDVDNVCVYCPADHPIYDATTKHCIREASVSTIKVGNCATLSTILESAFTDITFADSTNQPLSTADYVAIAYSCPVE